MLRRSNRIQGQSTVEAIIKKGSESKSSSFFLKSVPNDLGYPRFGIVISKKLEKSAVKRNRRRRQIYEIIRSIIKDKTLPFSPSSDIVLLARKSTMNLDFDELNSAVREILTSKTL